MMSSEVRKTFKIFIGNLSPDATKEDLHYLFSQYGQVVEAVVMIGKLFGFVHMAYEEDGWKAICELRGRMLKGKAMAVEASINAKRAAPLAKRNIIGKGVSNIDDFDDISSKNKRILTHQPPTEGNAHAWIPSPQQHFIIASSGQNVGPYRPDPLYSFPPFGTAPSNSNVMSVNNSVQHSNGPFNSNGILNDKVPVSSNGIPTNPSLSGFSRVNGPYSNRGPLSSSIVSTSSVISTSSRLSSNSRLSSSSGLSNSNRVSPQNEIQGASNLEDAKSDSRLLNLDKANSNPIINQDSNNILSQGHSSFCGVCGSTFDDWQHTPKILSCRHTFCADCLISLAHESEVKCPLGCPYKTSLASGGISGLTTNFTVTFPKFDEPNNPISPPVLPPGFNHLGSTSRSLEVCRTCLKFPADITCTNSGHQLISENHARSLFRTQLSSSMDLCLRQLRQAMNMRACIKERLERTVHSVKEFAEELKRKVEGEELEEAMLQELLNDLNQANDKAAADSSIAQLLDSLRTVYSYNQSITVQYNQCSAVTAINNATEAIVIKLKSSALNSVLANVGFSREEAFTMTSSLEQHAMCGNNANVLLLYMLSDLLSSRLLQLVNMDISKVNQIRHGITPPIPSPIQNNVIEQENMTGNDPAGMNVEYILKMTEAIEKGPLLSSSKNGINDSGLNNRCQTVASSALSLGLSNLTLLGSESREILRENSPLHLEDDCDSNQVPFSYLDAAKKPAKPTTNSEPQKCVVQSIAPTVKAGKFPHCWMKISINDNYAGRIIFELRPDKAPRMCENFIGLCTGKPGYGYKGTHFFKSGEGFLAGGDVEHDDGTGGYSIFDKQLFEADLCPLKDCVGMVRFKGIGTSDNGRGNVGSQFMIWATEREFKQFAFSLVFGRVVDGLDVAQKASSVNVTQFSIKVEDCGAV